MGKVYVVNSEYQADEKVYVVNSEYQADEKVYIEVSNAKLATPSSRLREEGHEGVRERARRHRQGPW